jgi:hypothetical protein
MTNLATNVCNAYEGIINPPKWFAELEEVHTHVAKAAKAFQGVVKYVTEVDKSISKKDYAWLSAIKFINSVGLIFNIPKLIKNIHNVFAKQKASDKIENAVNTVITAGDIVDSGTAFITGLKDFGYIAASSLPWTDLVGKILFPLQFLALQSNVSEANKNLKLKEKIFEKIKTTNAENSIDKRIENLVKSMDFVQEEWEDIRKPLKLSEKMQVPERIEAVRKEILSEKTPEEKKAALEEGEKLMETLKTRAKTKFSVQLASTIARIVSLAVSGILLFTAVSMPVGWVLLGATLGVGLIAFALEKIMLNKNPLAEPGDSLTQQFAKKVRDGIFKLSNSVESAAERVSEAVQGCFNHAEPVAA